MANTAGTVPSSISESPKVKFPANEMLSDPLFKPLKSYWTYVYAPVPLEPAIKSLKVLTVVSEECVNNSESPAANNP